MKSIEIKSNNREKTGKTSTNSLRKEGNVPCVLYGGNEVAHFSAKEIGFPGRLFDLATALEVDLTNAHEALADTHALSKVLIRLIEISGKNVNSPVFQPMLFKPDPSGLFKQRPSVDDE